jgi:hypothetical protein
LGLKEGRSLKKLTARETVVELLRTYQDVTCPLNSAGDWIGGGPGSRMHWREPHGKNIHPYYEGSYRTLEAILRHMQSGGGLAGDERYELAKWCWAVAQTYVVCERRMAERKAKNNRTVTVIERFTEPVRNGAVRQDELDLGVDWITAEFSRRGASPFLPREILQTVAA